MEYFTMFTAHPSQRSLASLPVFWIFRMQCLQDKLLLLQALISARSRHMPTSTL
jgi:hypothetical protein